ncbi:MAG: hypothetical protein FJZ04_02865 [Candidatus Moranbacteria bacterium]|nr:hypothetical protein [Candidatus Moranbacteria bacterium]
MILTTHFVTGSAVASLTDNSLLVITISVVLHFLLDMIPHWEYITEELDSTKELKNYLPQLAIDILLGPLLVSALFCYFFGFNPEKMFWLFGGGFFGVLPDGLTFLGAVFPQNKVLRRLYYFHCWIQPKKVLGWQLGILTQLIIVAVALYVIAQGIFL